MLHRRAKLLLMRSRSSFPCCTHFLDVAEDKLAVLGNWQKSFVNARLPVHTRVCSCTNTQTYVPKWAMFFSSQTGLASKTLRNPKSVCASRRKLFITAIAVLAQHFFLCESCLICHNWHTPPVLEYWQLWRLRSFTSPRKDSRGIPFPTQRITWSQQVISEWFFAVSGWLWSKALSFCLQISKVSMSPSPFVG